MSDMEKKPLKPAEILDAVIGNFGGRAGGSFSKLFILAIMAGAFIAFAAQGSNMAAFNLLAAPGTYGVGRALAGFVFGTGLMLVILCGAELFTGNNLIIACVLDKKVTMGTMFRNWTIVIIGNFIGSVLIAYMLANSGLLGSGGGLLGAVTLKIAVYKVNLSFIQAFYLGIMCNWLVCLAIWMASGADTAAGKILSCLFPISLFVMSGFEHSVANMYYIPAGLFVKSNAVFAELAGITPEMLDSLTWGTFAVHNLVPVVLGNIVGGGIFTGMAYWYVYKKA